MGITSFAVEWKVTIGIGIDYWVDNYAYDKEIDSQCQNDTL